MYAVVRAGGKQYKVAPGDVLNIEKQAGVDGIIEFEWLAVSDNGKITRPQGEARVVGQILDEGRAKKILVFHFKRKKQYKKLNGHRQPFTAVRITEITFDGQTIKAPEAPARKAKAAKADATPEGAVAPKRKTTAKKSVGAAKKNSK